MCCPIVRNNYVQYRKTFGMHCFPTLKWFRCFQHILDTQYTSRYREYTPKWPALRLRPLLMSPVDGLTFPLIFGGRKFGEMQWGTSDPHYKLFGEPFTHMDTNQRCLRFYEYILTNVHLKVMNLIRIEVMSVLVWCGRGDFCLFTFLVITVISKCIKILFINT